LVSSSRTRLRRIACCHRLSSRTCQLGYDPAYYRELSPAGNTFAASLLLREWSRRFFAVDRQRSAAVLWLV
jgi:hypothetical protein